MAAFDAAKVSFLDLNLQFALGRPMLVLALIGVVAVLYFAGQFAVAQCQRSDRLSLIRLERLETEIQFRRDYLARALGGAHTRHDIDLAARALSVSSPGRYPEMKGLALSDLSDEYGRLRSKLEPENGRPQGVISADTWLVREFPVDEEGYLYGSPVSLLPTLRKAAMEEANAFRAHRLFPLPKERRNSGCSPALLLALFSAG